MYGTCLNLQPFNCFVQNTYVELPAMPKGTDSTQKQHVKYHTITSLFKKQTATFKCVACPACGQQVGISAINKHLDENCSSLKDGDAGKGTTEFEDSIGHSTSAHASCHVETGEEVQREIVSDNGKTKQFENFAKAIVRKQQKNTTSSSPTEAAVCSVNVGHESVADKLNLKRKRAESVYFTKCSVNIKESLDKREKAVLPKQFSAEAANLDNEFHFISRCKGNKRLTFDGQHSAKFSDVSDTNSDDDFSVNVSKKKPLVAECAQTLQIITRPTNHCPTSVQSSPAALPSMICAQKLVEALPGTSACAGVKKTAPQEQVSKKLLKTVTPEKSFTSSNQDRAAALPSPSRQCRKRLFTPTASKKQATQTPTPVKKRSPKKRSPLFKKVRSTKTKASVQNNSVLKSPLKTKSLPNSPAHLKSLALSPFKLHVSPLPSKVIQVLECLPHSQHYPDKPSSKTHGNILSQGIDGSPSSSKSSSSSPFKQQSQTNFQGVRRPYYLENYLFVLKTVLKDPDDSKLFNDEDKRIIDVFYGLPVESQKLYVRMFQRKQKWHQVSKIEYPDISDNIELVSQSLISEGLMLSENDLDISDLSTVLDILQLPELKTLCKTLNINYNGAQKKQLVEQILKQSRQQRTMFSASGGASFGQVILKRAKHVLGSCMKIAAEPKRVFIRILILFSLTHHSIMEDDGQNGQQQLLTLLFVNMGKIIFAPYTVLRKAKIFRDRDDLLRYESASQLEYDLASLIESSNWSSAYEVYSQSKMLYEDVRKDSEFLSHVASLPAFLRRFTCGAAYIRCLNYAIEVLQRLRNYDEAVRLLEILLEDPIFHLDYHGHWMERLALNLEQHLKRPKDALAVLMKAFKDPHVTSGHRLSLHQRATRLCNSASNAELKQYTKDIPEIPLYEIPKVYIEGRQLPRGSAGGKSVFLAEDSQGNNEVDVCSVEEFVIKHYKKLGYDEGIHGESATFLTLYCLLFWDIIFMSGIPDVFRSPFQHLPLDINYSTFYTSRKIDIEERLEWIKTSPLEILIIALGNCWTTHLEEVSLVSWNLFRGLEQVESLVKCLRPPVLASLCERYAKDFRHCRSGFPDLVVWNSETSQCRVIEVKGPNDRLSTKQILWLDYLLGIGITAEVCHVTVGKKLKKRKKESPKKPP